MEVDILRLCFVFFAGYFLCLSGSLTQLITNNAIASPSTLGMDGIAVLALIISQLLIQFSPLSFDLEVFAIFIFFLISLVMWVMGSLFTSKSKNLWDQLQMKRVIILGLSFNLFIGAIFSVVQFMFMALNFDFPSGIWFGNFKQYQALWIWPFGIIFILTLIIVHKFSPQFILLNLGRNFALGRNINVEKLQKFCLGLSLLLTGVVICFFGVFSFLGLIFPHILRAFPGFKSSMAYELKYGAMLAGLILCFIDFICYNLTFYGAEFPVGMTSSIIGAFFLIVLVLRQKV